MCSKTEEVFVDIPLEETTETDNLLSLFVLNFLNRFKQKKHNFNVKLKKFNKVTSFLINVNVEIDGVKSQYKVYIYFDVVYFTHDLICNIFTNYLRRYGAQKMGTLDSSIKCVPKHCYIRFEQF